MRGLLVALLFLLDVPDSHGDWIVYENCEFQDHRYFDGDSFYAKTREGVYIFRLYGVDCPETDDRFPERLEEQARYFDIPVAEIPMWGERAAAFTREFLSRPFSVHTKKEEAKGESRQERYFAIVEGADGQDLGLALLEAGLARAYGMPADWQAASERNFRNALSRQEAAARTRRVGIWARDAGRMSAARILIEPLGSSR